MTTTHPLLRARAETEGRVVPTLGMELREVDSSHRYLEGLAVPYGVAQDVGWYVETIEKGCFAKSIREAANGLPLLLFHNSSSLDAMIGVAESWKETNEGLRGVWKLDPGENAQRAATMARDGLLGYMSVGFVPIRSTTTFDDADDKVYVGRQEARLLEVSLTPTPAYQAATVTKVRTAEASLGRDVSGRDLAGWKDYLEQIRTT